MTRLILYGTTGCHLCEEAKTELHKALRLCQAAITFECVDIADNPELTIVYGLRIPVIRERSSCAELDWPFSAAQIITFLRADRLS